MSDEITQGGVARLQRRSIAENPQSKAGPGDGHVEAPLVRQESHHTSLIGPHCAKDDDIHLSALQPTAEVMTGALVYLYCSLLQYNAIVVELGSQLG